MAKQEAYHLHPAGWENDPEEERFRFSTLDYLTACSFSNYALFFKLDDGAKQNAVDVLKAGLQQTLSQVRHLCGTIEKDPNGGHSFVKRKESTVHLFVQWLDGVGEDYPTFDHIEESHFRGTALGDLSLWSVSPMTYGQTPEAHPDSSPVVAAFKANFIRGGLVFNMHHHHYANDVMGWTGFTHQLAENCNAIFTNPAFPKWDPACLDLSRITKQEPPEEAKVAGPAPAEHPPNHRSEVSLLFHLPASKAAELKKLATPTDGSWVSTYDAFSAFIWRILSRLRAPIFKLDMSSHLFWSENVDMRRRLQSPKCPPRTRGNVLSGAISNIALLASYIRKLTNSVTQESLDQQLDSVATIRDKTALCVRLHSYPPLTIIQTDHRDANVNVADFGFATPVTYRNLCDDITQGVMYIYPPRLGLGSDEGCEFSIAYEKHLARELIEDPEWNKFFEYRGVDCVNARDGAENE
ncbi:hypothetical protein BO70DRAFT_379138 [Aspergillus heteromorphus CBS 117.55]|uniref:Trichothecene 3-O-acetyltransferase-like N-terminal domain-containing protein n=1 Tax=Aspergillus heteromorphus CBS 117.55 TaxID=1448321 RepID=A0A317WH73_9EURO|nr:uncharacterized protein BO70DRAFT_379138 [Aspergillus heteromorphus CBS 117.55]PWY85041.1 hypothetical protein BO70DRAFT_379138 [Aspergillus heteromorphus CBS 117.55]